MKFAARACLVLALLGGISCVIPSSRFDQSKRVRLNPRGERMIIRMAGRAKISGEFLFSDETGIWLLLENPNAPFGGEAKTRQVPYGDTEECEVVSLVNRNWGPTVIISQILPALALGAASAIAETDPLASVGLTVGASLPALVTFLLFNSKNRRCRRSSVRPLKK